MNNPQDAHQEEGPDSEILKLSNGGGAKIEKNNVDIPEEPFPTSPPHEITNSVAVTENPILSTTAILSEEVLPAVKVSPIEVERVIEGADDVALETMNCKTEPVTRDFDCQEKGAFQEKAAGMIMEPVDLDVKLGTHKSDHEETSGTDDMAVDLGNSNTETDTQKSSREEPMISEGSTSEEEQPQSSQNPEISETPNKSSDATKPSDEEEDEEEEEPPPKKQKQLSLLSPITPATGQQAGPSLVGAISEPNLVNGNGSSTNGKKSSKKKSKNNNVWTKPTSRKGKKKSKNINSQSTPKATEDTVWITPVPRFLDKNDDSTDMKICLSKVYKAEKVELSDDRLTAGSCKGYRMVRATRGVTEGAWYFEIKVMSLGETGHTRLGWSTEKGDLQAPVGYDTNSFGYRDIDGSKVHKALREKYGEKGYKEGDVIGFYISLPEGNLYAPKPPRLVLYKGQRYVYAPDAKEEPPKVIPGSEISFFKNGVCQGVAFRDLYGGRYYPAASMYTLPNQPNCMVKFNFGPDFEHFPEDLGSRPAPAPMFEVPYHGFDHRVENGDSNEKNQ